MSNPEPTRAEPLVFHSLVIEHFRGFNESIPIPLDASAVVVSGANGRGKTSLFDAIQWLILGRIERLEELRYRKEEYIINKYAPKGSKAKISGKLRLDGNSDLTTVTRTGDSNSSILEIEHNDETIVGETAQAWLQEKLGKSKLDKESFQREFLNAGLLQQDVVRKFLSASPADRHQVLAEMLGISTVTDFISQLDESAKLINGWINDLRTGQRQMQETINSIEKQIKESLTRIETAPELSEAVAKLKMNAGENGLGFLLAAYSDNLETHIDPFFSLIRECRQLVTKIVERADAIGSHNQQKPTKSLQELQENIIKLEKQIESERSTLRNNESDEAKVFEKLRDMRSKADNMRQLAINAIPLLKEQCPVCGQQIDPEKVRRHLESVASEQPELLKAEQDYRQLQDSIQVHKRTVSQLESEYRNSCGAKTIVEEWQSHLETMLNELMPARARLQSAGFTIPETDSAGVIEWLPQIKNWATEYAKKLSSLEMLSESILAAQSVGRESAQLERLKQELEHLQGQWADKNKTLDRATRALTERRLLVEMAKEKEIEVVEEIFNELQPVVQDLFSRLAPHPTFRQLTFSHEVYYRKGSSMPKAIDPLWNLETNPSITFSSAQANVAAICYFLALAFSSSTTDFGFVLLDDPLQSMDDVNVLGFSDLCRFLKREKQLIIATHDERLSSLLIRKLTSRDEPLKTLELNFRSWDSSGPVIKEEWQGITKAEPILAGLN